MAQNMGEVIRRLRKERDLTQEELAEQLGVTSQAVSKWENNTGMPDISQIVPLANYFGVSTDTLFDFCSEDKAREIEEFKMRASQLSNKGRIPELVELCREAVNKYPGSYEPLSRLANALFNLSPVLEENAKESVAICEKILSGCTDSKIRENAIQLLTYWHCLPFLSIADEEKAVSYAKMGGDIWTSSNILLEHAYFTEESKQEARKTREQNILNFLDHICLSILYEDNDDIAEEILKCKTALTLWNTIIPDGNFLFYHCRIFDLRMQMAKCHARLSEKAEAMNELRLAKYHAQMSDTIPKGKHHYTGPFVSGAICDTSCSAKNYAETELERFRNDLKSPCFDFLRGDPEFIALTE